MTPAATPLAHSPQFTVLLDQLAAVYLLFAFNEAVVLRAAAADLRVWRALVLGMVLCDVAHLWAAGRALRGWEGEWRWEDGVNLGMLGGPLVLRLAFLAGVGMERSGKRGKGM